MNGPDVAPPINGNGQPSPIPGLDGLQRLAGLAFVVGLGICVALSMFYGAQGFFRSYFLGYLYWLAFPIGSIGLLLINHLAGGTWGLIIRRPLEASAATMVLMTILFLPIAAGIGQLYPWAGVDPSHPTAEGEEAHTPPATAGLPDETPAPADHAEGHAGGHADELYPHAPFTSPMGRKAFWFQPAFFFGRAIGYFALWNVLALLLNKWSADQDRTSDPAPTRRLRSIGAGGLILLFLTGTFALFDWAMSLDTAWYSTIYGAMLLIGMAQATMALTLITTTRLVDRGLLGDLVTTTRLRDLGNLLLALTMLWAYTSFSQFLIMWSGNIAEETPWYLRRSHGGWQYVVGFLMIVGFFLPFVALLFRSNKHRTARIRVIAGLILAIHLVDVYWLVGPDLGYDRLVVPFQALAAWVGLGGLWLYTYTFFLRRKPLLSVNDPALAELREYDLQHGHGQLA